MDKSRKLVIVGAASNGKLARYYFERDTEYSVAAYVVEKEFLKQTVFDDRPVLPFEEIEEHFPKDQFEVFVAVGYTAMNAIREKLYNRVKSLGYRMPNYISPRCHFLSDEKIGENNFILEDNTIQPFVRIGSNNVLWSGNHIGHDVSIGDNNFITSHVVISGFTKVGNNCFFGVNSTFRDGISISDKTLVAAGAIIMEDTEIESVYVPARSTKISKKSTEIRIS